MTLFNTMGDTTQSVPKAAIIVLNWNRWRDTVLCLESICAMTYPNCKVFVVDNGSTDDSVRHIKTWMSERGIPFREKLETDLETTAKRIEIAAQTGDQTRHFTLIKNGWDLGYTAGNNVGIRHALQDGADYILLLNDDTKVSPDLLGRMLATAEKDPAVGIVGCKIYSLEEPAKVQFQGGHISLWFGLYGFFDRSQGNKRGEIDSNFAPGCALLIKREVLESIGLLEEKYFMYAEDVEFPHRALKAGWKVRINLDASIWHRSVPERGSRSTGYYYYGTRNFLYFISDYLRGLQKASCLLFFVGGRLLLVAGWILKGRYQHVKATWEGLRDFRRGVTGLVNSEVARTDERVKVR